MHNNNSHSHSHSMITTSTSPPPGTTTWYHHHHHQHNNNNNSNISSPKMQRSKKPGVHLTVPSAARSNNSLKQNLSFFVAPAPRQVSETQKLSVDRNFLPRRTFLQDPSLITSSSEIVRFDSTRAIDQFTLIRNSSSNDSASRLRCVWLG